eukprot:CAMPEP_0201608506 /NCGR_PEP_ID=MMETSP0492-20130828/7619_1 /ASSEMBLY_ACC=CAM_ASM_000837 /TAXON_ID=420259 /ORGANISM="Thalassiosira gravida, Strain GMp14c1" /LENGTH=36 /DNA_ID= /DNA_START= /DNA_END= /DNA_ORIENTATION=
MTHWLKVQSPTYPTGDAVGAIVPVHEPFKVQASSPY